ncbi:MAG: hypothetical protein IT336_11410 [Thermomicrobiales bacterium]|nr:hypothetical protein [Thermomicrobiales bacterium]
MTAMEEAESDSDYPVWAKEAMPRLEQLIADAGLSIDTLQPGDALPLFAAFMRMPVDCEDDSMLVEIGTYTFGVERFLVSLTRQFTFYQGEEYDHMEQLNCTFALPPRDDLRPFTLLEWTYDQPTLDAFIAHVEQSPAWQTAISQPGYICEIIHGWV